MNKIKTSNNHGNNYGHKIYIAIKYFRGTGTNPSERRKGDGRFLIAAGE